MQRFADFSGGYVVEQGGAPTLPSFARVRSLHDFG
jgi:hypothetical protein